MRTRLAKKIIIATGAYKGFETFRQPYTPSQQRKALKVLKIPVWLRNRWRVCNRVADPAKDCKELIELWNRSAQES